MRLFFGKENRNGSPHNFNDNYFWNAAVADMSINEYITAPDGSSLAEVWVTPGLLWTTNLNTNATNLPLPTEENYAYIISYYIKAPYDGNVRFMSSLDDEDDPYPDDKDLWALNATFVDKTISNVVDSTSSTSYGLLRYGAYPVGNGWYRMWGIYDTRRFEGATPSTDCLLKVYPNAPLDSTENGVALWGMQMEKSRRRTFPTPFRYLDGTSLIGADYTMIEFTQMPSNLDEIDNDIYTTQKTTDGSVKRYSTYSDKNIKALKWNLINYKTHGHMIYWLSQSVADIAKRDCILEYNSSIKRTIRSADIRPTKFTFNYLDIPNMASVELEYVIIDSYNY